MYTDRVNLKEKYENELPQSVIADQRSNVQIGKIAHGIFSSKKAAKRFINLGINDILKYFNKAIKYVDFGGGEGFLAKEISKYLISIGYSIDTLVADANEIYLREAAKMNLKTWLGNIAMFEGTNYDLITMRSVNHYNNLENQNNILKVVWKSLKKNGFFVTQIVTVHNTDCQIISKILNLPSLGRVSKHNQIYITTIDEWVGMLKASGFLDCKIKGIVSKCSWSPEESWDRFNADKHKIAILNNNDEEIQNLEDRKKRFILESYDLIKNHVANNKDSTFKKSNNTCDITLKFPLIQARK